MLTNTMESWKHFPLLVTVVPSGLHMERYRQLARSQNMRHYLKVYVQFTIFDVLYNLQIEKNRPSLTERGLTASMVAESFSGTDKYGLASIKQTAETAMRLSMVALECIKQFGELKDPELQSETLNKYGVRNTDELATVRYCQPYT